MWVSASGVTTARVPCALGKNIFALPSTKLQSLKWKIGAKAEKLQQQVVCPSWPTFPVEGAI